MRAHVEQNLTYADRDGHIYYLWNAADGNVSGVILLLQLPDGEQVLHFLGGG